MKVFIAYRSTGEDPKKLKPLMNTVKETFEKKGIDTYSTFFDKEVNSNNLSPRQIVDRTLAIIDKVDYLFVLQTTENRSEGMLIEVGYCLAKNIPIIIATKDNVMDTYLPALTSESYTWSNEDDLLNLISGLNL